jgi:hypothetical protein
MFTRIVAACLVFAVVMVPKSLAGQTMITFEAPVKLTQLAPEILAVRMYCEIKSQAIVSPNPGQASAATEVPVIAGQVVTTFVVVLSFPQGTLQSPVGQTATYSCFLQAKTQNGLGGFSATTTIPAFVLKPDPAPITGTFVW